METGGREPTDVGLTGRQSGVGDGGRRVIFVQPQMSGRSARAVAEAVGARLVERDPLERDVCENLVRMAEGLVDAYGGDVP